MDMDTQQIGRIMNSTAFRIAKGVVAAIFVGNANKAIKEGQVFGGLSQLAVAGILGGTAADKCPTNLVLGLPLDGEQARRELN